MTASDTHQNATNRPCRTGAIHTCTNEFPSTPPRPAIDPLAALRTRIRRLLDGAGRPDPDQRDLAAAMLAARLPGAAPYHGPIELPLLDQALAPLHFDAAALTWLAGLAEPPRTRVA